MFISKGSVIFKYSQRAFSQTEKVAKYALMEHKEKGLVRKK